MNDALPLRADSYVFWIYDWSSISFDGGGRLTSRYIQCVVAPDTVSFHSHPSIAFHLPMQKLMSVERYIPLSGTPGATVLLAKLTFATDVNITLDHIKRNTLYIAPMDPLGYRPSTQETIDLVVVMNAMMKGLDPGIHPNPYYREFRRRGKLADFHSEEWDPSTPPSIYRPLPSIGKIIKFGLGIVLMIVLLLAVIGMVYNIYA